MVKFDSFQLPDAVLRAISEMGFEEASPIQEAIIPLLLSGRDAIGQAQTGTGKTAAFGIPLVVAGLAGKPSLVLCPTRELAQQVALELNKLGAIAGIKAIPLFGGAAFGPQARAMQTEDFSIIVATPGRLLDHIERGTFSPDAAKLVVLDEADEMLKMGFIDDVEKILDAVGKDRQMCVFSATMPEPIMRIAERAMKNPEFVAVAGDNDSVASAGTEQLAVAVDHNQKLDALVRFLFVERPTGSLVFRHTRETVDELVQGLRSKGISARALHGGMQQGARDEVLGQLRSGSVKVLVATNVAARGLDVDTLSHVFNYDTPREAEAYVHRIGRTGRAGRSGRSFLFVTRNEAGKVRGIERVLGTRLEWVDVPTDQEVHASMERGLSEWLATTPLAARDEHVRAVDSIIAQGADPRMLAAKLLASLARHEGLVPPPLEAQQRRFSNPAAPSRNDRHDRGDRFERPDRHAHPRLDRQARPERNVRSESVAPMMSVRTDGAMIAIAIQAGREDFVRPGDLVGALANETGLTGGEIGRIDILPRMSVVEIPAHRADDVIETMRAVTVRGRMASPRLADNWQFRNPPR